MSIAYLKPSPRRHSGLLHLAFMYAKTNPGTGRLSSRQKRVFAVVGVLVVALLAGLGAWAALASDRYSSSGHGCVNVTVPSSTGPRRRSSAASPRRSFCQTSFRKQDQISLRARPQCVLAGLGPSASASPG